MQIALPIPLRRGRALASGRWTPALVVLSLVIIGGAAFLAYQRFATPAAPATTTQAVPVRRDTITSSVSATGTVVATKQARLVFSSSGRVKEINVAAGDRVRAGQ